MTNLLEEIRKLNNKVKVSSLTQKEQHELASKKENYKNLFELWQKNEREFHEEILNSYVQSHNLLIDFSKISNKPLEQKLIKNIFTSLLPRDFATFTSQLNDKTYKYEESKYLLCPKHCIPYLVELDKFLSGDVSTVTSKSFVLDRDALKEMKTIAFGCIQKYEQPEPKNNKKSDKRREIKAQIRQIKADLADPANSEKEQKTRTPEKSPAGEHGKEQKNRQQPVKKIQTTMSWHDFMKLCESNTQKFMHTISTTHESPEVIILRQWRGYNTDEEMQLFIYPTQVNPGNFNAKMYCIEVNENNLPKMVDSPDSNWDTFHAFSTEIESRYLPKCAFIVGHGDEFATINNINLEADQYALCIRAKFLMAHRRYDAEYALRNKNSSAIGTDGHIVYIINKNTHECVHRFFHKLK